MRSYSDDQLLDAIQRARSWRGVLRDLGLRATSGSAIRSVKHHATRLGADHRHFTGQRGWSDGDLAQAVGTAAQWSDVVRELGLAPGSSDATVRGHALRLSLDTGHLDPLPHKLSVRKTAVPERSRLRRAGSLIAASWFELTGSEVSWPLEPCRYDLLVMTDDRAERVQVKTTTTRSGTSWEARLTSTSSRGLVYTAGEVDQFFVITGDLALYLIPFPVVGGLRAVVLSAYESFRLPPLEAAF